MNRREKGDGKTDRFFDKGFNGGDNAVEDRFQRLLATSTSQRIDVNVAAAIPTTDINTTRGADF